MPELKVKLDWKFLIKGLEYHPSWEYPLTHLLLAIPWEITRWLSGGQLDVGFWGRLYRKCLNRCEECQLPEYHIKAFLYRIYPYSYPFPPAWSLEEVEVDGELYTIGRHNMKLIYRVCDSIYKTIPSLANFIDVKHVMLASSFLKPIIKDAPNTNAALVRLYNYAMKFPGNHFTSRYNVPRGTL